MKNGRKSIGPRPDPHKPFARIQSAYVLNFGFLNSGVNYKINLAS
uniref:Uncharacterized protein n=1 Tax=Anguilla anguilla TaxID=7936 RepID=A0A0E9WHZ2_ANGAN